MFSSCLVFFWFFLHWVFLLIGKFTKNLWCLCWIHRMLQGPLWCEIPHGFSDIFMWVVLVKCSSYEILVFYTEKIVLPNFSSQLYLKQVFQGFVEQNFTITIFDQCSLSTFRFDKLIDSFQDFCFCICSWVNIFVFSS